MKKMIRKLKGKKVLSLVLAAIMLATTFNIALPMLKLDANAATTIDGVSQTQIVTDTSVYNTYASNYLGGAGFSTGIIIPGLDPAQDYVIQGMTYYPKRDWMLVTAYHNDGTASSKVFALDAKTGNFVAMFSFLNVDGSENMDHGGGIAVSENNIYYSCGDKDRKIAYAPLSALENAPLNAHTQIQLVAEKDFVEIGSVSSDDKTAYSAYVCYDEGVLWMGNFYDMGAKLLGVTIAAADYNAPSNNQYNSMVFGYKLSGSSSAEEWANLTGAKGTDCQGNPSYAIGLSNNIKDVQYAVVDNGKLYLSRSYGSGAGNSISFGFGENSYLTVADIDLSQPGDTSVTISTTGTGSLDKTVMAYDISDYVDYAMMPMSEGLCVIDGDLFITFEGASNKYLNESDGVTSIGNCDKPVDVIWQLDPYDLMNVEVAEAEKSIYYQKINSLDEIENGKEYIIVHESTEEDPFTQEKILYALDAFGNFKDYKLSKSQKSVINGYDGMIGHPITDYDITEDGILYLNDPENDDVENVRWTLTRGSGDNFKIANTSTYFANCNYLYFDASHITMVPGSLNALSNVNISQLAPGNGKFYLNNGGAYYLWCNEGVKADYNSKINTYYANNAGSIPMYSGLTEQKGTIHCDAVNGSGNNIIGQSIPDDGGVYSEGAFYIFERVVDETSSTYESRVYTGLDAKLQADGTYTVTLETYAISPNHYQYRGVKPTDYIIIADTSGSMESVDGTGIVEYTGDLGVASLSLEANTSDDNGTGVSGYAFTNPEEDIYIKHSDGKYYKVYMGVNTTELKKTIGIITKMRQKYYVYYIADDGLYYCVQDHTNIVARNYADWKAWIDSGENESDYSTKTSNENRRKESVYTGYHYRFDNVSHHPEDQVFTRFNTLKEATKDLIADIATENSENRIALVTYGSGSSYLGKNGWATSGYTDALWKASDNKGTLQTAIDNVEMSTQTSNDGIEFNNVNEIIANSGAKYTGTDSDRNVAVIFITDGVAGADSSSGNTTAANNVIAKALTAKKSGAFIYTAVIGADGSSFDRNTYLEAVSSKYAEAASMTDLGGQSVDGVNYNLNLATATIDNFINFGGFALKETSVNNGVGLENLDANSYLREQLSEAFMFPADTSEYEVKVELVPGVFDKIGRFSFDETNATTNHQVSSDIDVSNRTITVTNYNYSEQYIAKNRTTPGNKLRITINGLLANPDADLTNTSINNTKTTGIFKTKSNMDNGVAFKYLPTEYFNIPKYTYVLDYGLQMLDTDVNGTLKAVSAGLTKQDVNNYIRKSENGLVAIADNNLDLLYSANPELSVDSGYVLIQRDDGTYDWFEIEVVPASNVYFEETDMTVTEKEQNNSKKLAWETVGTATQTHRVLPDEDDVDGFENAYDVANSEYSNGTARKVTVNAENKNSKNQTFDFKGTGVDVISRCDDTTGIMLVSVKQEYTGDDGKTKVKYLKSAIIDTYCAEGTFNQAPIFSWSGDYGKYTVDVGAMYLASAGKLNAKSSTKGINKSSLIDTGLEMNSSTSFDTDVLQAMLDEVGVEGISAEDVELIWFDDNSILNGGTGVAPSVKKNRAGETATGTDLVNYIDGFRIYNPVDPESETKPAYAETEKNASYINVAENLTEICSSGDTFGNIAYFTGGLGDGETLDFAKYQKIGPTGELYLKAGESITFKISRAADEKVMLGLRAVNGPATAKVNNVNIEKGINSATEMYYDITNCGIEAGAEVPVTVTNNGSGLLAINHIKFSGGAAQNNTPVVGARSMTRSTTGVEVTNDKFLPITEEDLVVIESTMKAEAIPAMVKNGVVIPIAEEEEIIPDDTTTPDDNNTNDDTNTDSGDSDDTFDIFSLLRMLIEFIKEILFNSVGSGKLF